MSAFRGPGGKISMTRVVAFMLAMDASVLADAISWYLVNGTPSAEVVAACAAVVGAFVAAGCVAIVNRTRGGAGDKTQ